MRRRTGFRELEVGQKHPLQLALDRGADNTHSKETETRAFLGKTSVLFSSADLRVESFFRVKRIQNSIARLRAK